MKKLNYLLLGATGLVLASCSQEDLVSNVGNGDGTANVTITLSTPQIQSRAYSDGTKADKLLFAVYEVGADGQTLTRLSDEKGEGNDYYTGDDESKADAIDIKKEKTFKLLTDHTYQFVFWAGAPTATGEADSPYTVTFPLSGNPTFSVAYDKVQANDENLDAFYGRTEKIKVTGNIQLDVPLYRPFAQINVGTNDYYESNELGYMPDNSKISVTNAYSKLDLITDAASEKADQAITFDYNAIPAVNVNEKPAVGSEKFPVNGYEYLAMAYVLVGEGKTNSKDKDNVTVSFSHKNEVKKTAAITRTISEVPVQRNHRTNIYGQVLTSDANLIIEIKPAYDDPDLEPSALEMAAALGGTVTLTTDQDIEGQLNFRKDAIVDLGGNTINTTGGTYGDAVNIRGANVTFKNGEIKPAENASQEKQSATVMIDGEDAPSNVTFEDMTVTGFYPIYVNSANPGTTVTIKSGTYYTVNPENPAVYVGAACGKVVITGGTFGKAGDQSRYVLNIKDGLRKPTTDKEPIDYIEVRGGTFINWNPADNASEGAHTNYVPKGYKVVEREDGSDKIYTVVPDNAIEVNDNGDVNSVMDAIALINEQGLKEATILVGNGTFSTKNSNATDTQWPNNATITFMGMGAANSSITKMDYFVMENSNLIFKDISLIVTENSTNHTALGLKKNASASFENVDIYGEYHVFDGDASFKNCNFYFAGGGNNQTRYGLYMETAGNVTLDGCTFDTSSSDGTRETKGILVYASGAGSAYKGKGGNLTLNNCNFEVKGKASTKAAVEIHTENYTSAGTIKINNTNFTPNGYISLWREIDGGSNAATTLYNVIVNGETEQTAK